MAVNKNITMKQYNGTDYDTLYPKTIAEQVDGIYSKEQVLTDITKSLYGLTSSAVPDDVFAAIGKYKQYWWRRRTVVWEENLGPAQTKGSIAAKDNGAPVKYSDSIVINQNDGTFALAEPIYEKSISSKLSSGYQDLLGKYVLGTPSGSGYQLGNAIQYIPDGDYDAIFEVSSNLVLDITGAQKVSTNKIDGDWQYIQSLNRNAYPDSGIQDGYEYEYLGVPFDNAVTAPKIETGSYVGTGTYGADNPNTLTFGFLPKLVIVKPDSKTSYYRIEIVTGQSNTLSHSSSASYGWVDITWNGKTVSWVCVSTNSDPVGGQLNNASTTYYYFAIG